MGPRGTEPGSSPCRAIAEGGVGKRNERGLRRKSTIQAASGEKTAFAPFREGRQDGGGAELCMIFKESLRKRSRSLL